MSTKGKKKKINEPESLLSPLNSGGGEGKRKGEVGMRKNMSPDFSSIFFLNLEYTCHDHL